MPKQLNSKMLQYYDALLGRKFFLSFPKSGRTWMMNVFCNYHERTLNYKIDPISFVYNQRGKEGARLKKKLGITFTHGFRLSNRSFDDMMLSLKDTYIADRKTCLMIRNPARVLFSYFIDKYKTRPDLESFNDFLRHDAFGIKAYAGYHEHVINRLQDNPKGIIFLYEDFHESNPKHIENFYNLFSFYFDDQVDEMSLKWAVKVCKIDVLRNRMPWNKNRNKPRVREGKTGIDRDDLLNNFVEPIMDGLKKYGSNNLKDFFVQLYF